MAVPKHKNFADVESLTIALHARLLQPRTVFLWARCVSRRQLRLARCKLRLLSAHRLGGLRRWQPLLLAWLLRRGSFRRSRRRG